MGQPTAQSLVSCPVLARRRHSHLRVPCILLDALAAAVLGKVAGAPQQKPPVGLGPGPVAGAPGGPAHLPAQPQGAHGDTAAASADGRVRHVVHPCVRNSSPSISFHASGAGP